MVSTVVNINIVFSSLFCINKLNLMFFYITIKDLLASNSFFSSRFCFSALIWSYVPFIWYHWYHLFFELNIYLYIIFHRPYIWSNKFFFNTKPTDNSCLSARSNWTAIWSAVQFYLFIFFFKYEVNSEENIICIF